MKKCLPRRTKVALVCGVATAAVAAWYAFRPELLFIDAVANEAAPAALHSAPVLASGRFHSVAHESAGRATVYELPDGRRTLRLSEFRTSNGPDVHVYLVAAADAADSATVRAAGYLSLGPLKGNIGDQSYELPTEADLSRHQAVTIWCRRFGVNFATAPLTVADSQGDSRVAGR